MRVVKRIKLKGQVEHSRNLFGPNEDLAGKWLDVLEVNREGECLSLLGGVNGHLVSVDPSDIEEEAGVPSNSFFSLDVVTKVEEFIGRSLRS